MYKRFLAFSVLSLALLGAGCATNDSPGPLKIGLPEPKEHVLAAAQTDATWKTYENARLGFSFQYPTKGKYAPEWEVNVGGPITCPENQDVGYLPKGMPFCIIGTSEGAAGSTYFTHTYRTVIQDTAVNIVFTKRAVTADIGDCVRAPDQTFWSEFSKPGSCIPFSEQDYKNTLDGIVGTFKTK